MAIAVEVPARPDGVELIGEMEGSGYRTPPSLVRRHDGQTLQLTPLLYAVLEAIDGRRGHDEIARVVSERTGRNITGADVAALIDRQLRPRGLLLQPDGTPPQLEKASPLTGLKLKFAVTNPAVTRRLTDPFTVLFHWWIWVPVLAAFGFVAWWVLVEHGLAASVYQAFAMPNLLLLVLVVTILSAGFHEFGHAAAARRGGAQPGSMGAGWLLLWPAFYTDVTDTYRLGKAARIRTDLGGLYFNAIVAVAIGVAWWVTGWDALLLIIAAQIIQMVRQLAPLVRFDGYHVLADVTGVPDLFSRIGPILMSFWPGRWNDPRVADLKLWTRLIVTAWVLVVVPLLLVLLVALVLAAPRLVGTAWASLNREGAQAALHWGAGQYLDAVGAVLAMAVIALPIVAMTVIFGRMLYTTVKRTWTGTSGRPLRRAATSALLVALMAGVAFAWWPEGERYRPVRPYEGGRLQDIATAPLAIGGYDASFSRADDGGEVLTVLPASGALPTEAEPALALVLVPTGEAVSGATDLLESGWVFPFNEPLPPEPGDNQARAINTTDSSTLYDVAIAMVWVTDDDPVVNVNEAYAFASCMDCVTVAIAFQVVAIVGSADVIVPQNLSGALNYECFECITAAIASQLVVTLDSLPDAEQQLALAEVWEDLMAFAESIPTLPLAEVISRLDEYKQEIAGILGVEADAAALATETASPSADASPESGTDASASPRSSPTASPRTTPAATTSTQSTPAAVTSTETCEPQPTPTASGTAAASPTSSATPTAAPCAP